MEVAGMEKRSKSLLGFALVFFMGAIVGLVIGGYGGARYGMSFVLDECLYRDAGGVQSQVVILRHLRAGEIDQAIEVLEARLDDDLIIFDPDEPYTGISDQAISEINKAIQVSREYRSANPRKSNRPHVDTMVGNILRQETQK
jgi:hypothetical protein